MVRCGSPKCKDDPRIERLAKALRVLSEPNRLRIVCFLKKGERCVCEVERELGISQQLTSFHLRVLRESGFLRCRREGVSLYYSIDEEFLKDIGVTFNEHVIGQALKEEFLTGCSG